MIAIDRPHIARRILLVVILMAVTALVAHAKAPWNVAATTDIAPAFAPKRTQSPRIDVVFALDTTGSMSGLIEGAKQKIWSVASAMADGVPTPVVRIGLVAYRDRGDAYVTQVHDLTDDIDLVYERLQAFSADGGGDTPESVNQALDDAVNRMSWSAGGDVYKVVFLVGDAPPHTDYQDDVAYTASVAVARSKGITINTVQCGNLAHTGEIWREIATNGAGQFAAIRQDGAMVAIETPMDAELAELNAELGETVIAWGDPEERALLARKVAAARASAPAVAASRLAYLSKSGKRVNSGRRDLVDAVKEGLADLAEIPADALPAEMRDLDVAARRSVVGRKIEQRAEIQAKIDALARKRDEHLRLETEKLAAAGAADGFDQQVLGTIREQAAAAGIRYE